MSNNLKSTISDVADALRVAGVDAFAVLAHMAATAGSEGEWDSGTIERVLAPMDRALANAALPPVDHSQFWASVATASDTNP
jgi:hypothetical protein